VGFDLEPLILDFRTGRRWYREPNSWNQLLRSHRNHREKNSGDGHYPLEHLLILFVSG
jgi:hypothetical protein